MAKTWTITNVSPGVVEIPQYGLALGPTEFRKVTKAPSVDTRFIAGGRNAIIKIVSEGQDEDPGKNFGSKKAVLEFRQKEKGKQSPSEN